jgi:hypothetical protein
MKALLRLGIATVAVAGLSACASTHQWTAATDKATQQPVQAHYEGDLQYVAAVEHIARRRGVQVRWVNAPLRRVDPSNQ